MKFKNNLIVLFTLTICVILSIVYFYDVHHYCFNAVQKVLEIKRSSDHSLTDLGNIGSFYGALFGVIGTVLIFITLFFQINQYRKDEFDRRFYAMLAIHRENLLNIDFRRYKGHSAISKLVASLHNLYKNVESALYLIDNKTDMSEDEKIVKIYFNTLSFKKKYIISYIALKISYGYFFYGLKNYYKNYNADSTFYITLVQLIRRKLKQHKIDDVDNVYDIELNNELGHYFRHLYNTVRYVATANVLDKSEKREYIRIIRSQLSDAEQVLIYYNGMSTAGSNWMTPISRRCITFFERPDLDIKRTVLYHYMLFKEVREHYGFFGVSPNDFSDQYKYIMENNIKLTNSQYKYFLKICVETQETGSKESWHKIKQYYDEHANTLTTTQRSLIPIAYYYAQWFKTKSSRAYAEGLRCLLAGILVGDPIDNTGENGNTSLHLAAGIGGKALCTWLVENGAHINATNLSGSTPLDMLGKNSSGLDKWLILRGAVRTHENIEDDQAIYENNM